MHILTIGIVIIFITASLSHCIATHVDQQMLRPGITIAADPSAYVHEATMKCRRLNFSGRRREGKRTEGRTGHEGGSEAPRGRESEDCQR